MMDLPPTAQVWIYEETEQKPRRCSPEEIELFEEYKKRKKAEISPESQQNVMGLARERRTRALEILMCEANEGNSDRDIYSRDYTPGPNSSSETPHTRWTYKNSHSDKAFKEMSQAIGWAAAGQMDQAFCHGLEALKEQSEAVVEASKELYDSAKDLFSRD
jgi:hypothetical protein